MGTGPHVSPATSSLLVRSDNNPGYSHVPYISVPPVCRSPFCDHLNVLCAFF